MGTIATGARKADVKTACIFKSIQEWFSVVV